MDVGELGKEQLQCTEDKDELLQRHCAAAAAAVNGVVVVLVHGLEAAAGCDLDCNVVAY